MSDSGGGEDLLDSDNTGIRARAVRVLGERTSQPGALKRLLERLEAEHEPRVLAELGRALRKHLTGETADTILGALTAVRQNATGARRDAADAMLREMGAALAELAPPPPAEPPAPIPSSGVHRIPRQGSSQRIKTGLAALLDPVDQAREHLDLGQPALAIEVLKEALRTKHERARLAAAWLGAVLAVTGHAAAPEFLAVAAQEPRPQHTDLERVRAYCRANGLVPLPAPLRESRPPNPPPAVTGEGQEAIETARGHLPERFQAVEHIGTGGMGVVFRALDTKVGQHIAIKMVSPDAWGDEHALKRFDAEARALARLSHPSVLRIFEIHSGAVPFFTMELLEGTPLDGLLGNPPPLPVLLRHLIAVLEALDHCHAAGIVHRDVKPRNVFVTVSGEVRLMDFGVVKSAGTTSVTKVGMIVGTPNYMSPEQLLGTRVDPRADIYAFGVTLFQMLAGVLPYRDPGEVLSRAAPSVRDWVDVPQALADVVEKCLKRSPDNRYQTCPELIAALTPFTVSAPARPTVRDVFAAVVRTQSSELIVTVRRILNITAEMNQEVLRDAQREGGESVAPEELYRLVVRCHLEQGGATDAFDEIGRPIEIPRPRRRQVEVEVAEELSRP